MSNPIEIIDENALSLARSLDIMVYSLDGLFERAVRENPTYPGIAEFWSQASEVSLDNMNRVSDRLRDAMFELKASLSDSERDRVSDSYDDIDAMLGEAYEAFGAFFAQAKLFYAKRLRQIVAAKAVGYDAYSDDPKIMLRNGQQWNFSDFAFLQTRQLLVNYYNDTKIRLFAEDSVEAYTLITDDPDLMYEVHRVEDYPDEAASMFHPRTTKLVGAPYVSTEPEM